ncbi:hypothetical protein CLOM_g15725, partial [Closterium sp. NIES-68]
LRSSNRGLLRLRSSNRGLLRLRSHALRHRLLFACRSFGLRCLLCKLTRFATFGASLARSIPRLAPLACEGP